EPRTMQFQGWIADPAAIQLAQAGGQDLDALRKSAESRDFRPQALGSTLALDMPVHRHEIRSANVIGILPGRDPRLSQQAALDTVNRWGQTSDLGVLGLGKSTADDVVRKVAAEQGRTVHGDPFPDRGAFYRSDMFPLARVGVPPVAVKGGPDYVGRSKSWGEE